MSKRRGRPPKRAKHNITGVRNQSRQQSRQQSLSDTSGNSSDSDGDYSDSHDLDLTELDSLAFLEVDSDHDDNDNEADWDEVAKEEFQDRRPKEYIKGPIDGSEAGVTREIEAKMIALNPGLPNAEMLHIPLLRGGLSTTRAAAAICWTFSWLPLRANTDFFLPIGNLASPLAMHLGTHMPQTTNSAE
ncbi:hypothetical protein B0H13DRAFT_1924815 [Mycena leptocephala]|nr:hypothetical protein B0H13DRAFT_1924815 [Mycena leptocephala]